MTGTRTSMCLWFIVLVISKQACGFEPDKPGAGRAASVQDRLAQAAKLVDSGQWDAAAAEYRSLLEAMPDKADAIKALGDLERRRGHIAEARELYLRASQNPDDKEALLGRAAVELQDHNDDAAAQLYARAANRWPADAEVTQALADFEALHRPRAFVYYENDLSFVSREAGAFAPLRSGDEIGAAYQSESRKDYVSGAETYVRRDYKASFEHFFGQDHGVDVRLRSSKYDYATRVSDFSAIDKFWELRARYTRPLTPGQVAAVRYTLRPTTLLTSGQTFNSHKIEAEIRSQWLPQLHTVFGTGWLRDLASNATSSSQLDNNSLIKVEAQYDVSDRLSLSGKYITNPDLDNSIDSTRIAQASYSFSGPFSALARYRSDKYKSGPNQNAVYVGVRYVPNNRFWSEFGLKQVSRGGHDSVDPLVSVVVRF